ncbi:MAG: 2-C-methyl-D-erythritol 2,4-cyclodiphosphate synthase [Ignavibacteriaceae bacterium]|nr:2-C-methyl-D-erythritol 2,4-cyclodiphosphate synthase [Ignavibacteriaceae bacterium]
MKESFRTGFGFDVHAFAKDRKLIIGGVEIPNDKGLSGHSDADVLLHAICDAMLGALSLGDIGTHFPDTELRFKDADSGELLSTVYKMILEKGYALGNLDAMLAMEKPKIASYITAMKKKISSILDCSEDQVSIKASTTEKLGFIGREEGVTAFASVLLKSIK